MSDGDGGPAGDGAVPAPIAGAGSAQEVLDSTDPAEDLPSAPLREDQIQNAVAFLSHPKVLLFLQPEQSSVSHGADVCCMCKALRRGPTYPVIGSRPAIRSESCPQSCL